jgi:cell division protein FtsZ
MKNGGVAILGSAMSSGENRALHAVEQALNSPLLNDSEIRGAKWILLNITSSAGEHEHTMDEAEAIQAYVQLQAGEDCDVILGMGHDPALEDRIAVTVIATGFNHKEIKTEFPSKNREPEKIIVALGENNPALDNNRQVNEVPVNNFSNPALSPFLSNPQPWNAPFGENRASGAGFGDIKFSQPQPEIRPFETPAPNVQPELGFSEPAKEDDNSLRISYREESTVSNVKPGERFLSAEEMEDKMRLEEQKRALEARAQRLRDMSFNIRGAESADEMESVPAYLRKNKKLEDKAPSRDNYYSGYTVGSNDSGNGPIQTINTFLDGNIVD